MTTEYVLEGVKGRGRPLRVLGLVVFCCFFVGVVAVISSLAVVIDMQMAEMDRLRLQISPRNMKEESSHPEPKQTCDCTQPTTPSAAEVEEHRTNLELNHAIQTTPCESNCHFDQPFNETTCRCMCGDGFAGDVCEFPPRDCSDFGSNGYVYIYLPESNERLRVVCSGGMMYICELGAPGFTAMRNSSWQDFKSGFNFMGSFKFWIGNEVIHSITTKTNNTYTLVVYVIKKDPGAIWLTSRYYGFFIEDETHNYTIRFSDSNSHPRGSETLFDNTEFRTVDFNNNDCTDLYGSGWWYGNSCPFPPPLIGNHSILGEITPFDEFYLNLKRE